VRYGVVEQMRQQYPVPPMCRFLSVSTSGYYAWRKRPPSMRAQQEPRYEAQVCAAHERTRETFGPEWLQKELAERGVQIGVHRIKRLRTKLGLRCKQKRKFKATTNSTHNLPVAPNILDQDFSASEPNQAWCGDITYIATDEGWLYLAGLKDLFSGALLRRPVELAHYCAHAYQKLVKQFGMEASKSRRGNCYDNVPIESFWGLLKNELVYYRKFATRAQAQKEITEYIEIFYNRQRTQERLNYLSPAAFTQRFHLNKIAA
jgi:putative transposase